MMNSSRVRFNIISVIKYRLFLFARAAVTAIIMYHCVVAVLPDSLCLCLSSCLLSSSFYLIILVRYDMICRYLTSELANRQLTVSSSE